MAASNKAAWIPGKAQPVKVDSAPPSKAGADEVVIRNGAVAINPVDWKMQDSGLFVKEWPCILGCDTAGEIVEVGSNVKNVKKGQRVLGSVLTVNCHQFRIVGRKLTFSFRHCLSLVTGRSENAAFQNYSAVPALLCAPIPDNMSYESASVLPLSISTAAAGLFQDDYLGLPLPVHDPKPTGKTVLIWGGSSSVGSSAIQLAVAAGVDVVTTASKRNHNYVSQLGAKSAYDQTSDSLVDDIVSALKGKDLIGVYDAIGKPSHSIKTTHYAILRSSQPQDSQTQEKSASQSSPSSAVARSHASWIHPRDSPPA